MGSDSEEPGRSVGEALSGSAPEAFLAPEGRDEDGRPVVVVNTKEHAVNERVLDLLAPADLFQRGGILVAVVNDDTGSAAIRQVRSAYLREKLTERVAFVKVKDGQLIPAHPPDWTCSALIERPSWPGVRTLAGIQSTPVLRPDGSVRTTPGYDAKTGIYFLPTRGASWSDDIGGRPTRETAREAADRLLEVVCDFPFSGDAHRAAYLAALLSPIARTAFDGPTPLVAIDANTPGSGKTKLVDVASLIAEGRKAPPMPFAGCEEERRKALTSIVMSGQRLALFDNVEQRIASPALDAILTNTVWEDRLLGRNMMVRLPVHAVFFVTGNNLSIGRDTARRSLLIRLESQHENPEKRDDFKHARLEKWVAQNRERLYAAALSILVAWFEAGQPDMRLPAWGSYEEWSRVVRNSLVWIDLPDPALTREGLPETDDRRAVHVLLLEELELLFIDQGRAIPEHGAQGLTIGEILRFADARPDLKDALLQFATKLETRAIAARFRKLRRSVIGGRSLDSVPGAKKTQVWFVRKTGGRS